MWTCYVSITVVRESKNSKIIKTRCIVEFSFFFPQLYLPFLVFLSSRPIVAISNIAGDDLRRNSRRQARTSAKRKLNASLRRKNNVPVLEVWSGGELVSSRDHDGLIVDGWPRYRARSPRIDLFTVNVHGAMQCTSPAPLACALRLDLPWKLRKPYLPRRGRGKHWEMWEIGIARANPLTVCWGEQGRAPRGQSRCRTYFHVAIPSVSRRVVNRSVRSKGKSDMKVARRNRKENDAASSSLLSWELGN